MQLSKLFTVMQSDIQELATYAKPMENPAEYLCCKMHPCILTTEAFNHACLSRSVLSFCILDCCDSCDLVELSPSNYRKAIYHQYIMYSHRYLGRGNRKVALSCVVCKIHDKYPAPDGNHLGFRDR